MPGVHDNHVFFTGYMSMHRGVDLTNVATIQEALELLKQEAKKPYSKMYTLTGGVKSVGASFRGKAY